MIKLDLEKIKLGFPHYKDTQANRDPDTYSHSLATNHFLMWNGRKTPSGEFFNLDFDQTKPYHFNLAIRATNLRLTSDSIIHTFSQRKNYDFVLKGINPEFIKEFYDLASTFPGYIIFPSTKIQGKVSLNVIRGLHPWIGDRFDFTLECIRRYYKGISNPLYEHLKRYSLYFDLFVNFRGFIEFFLLHDLTDEHEKIKFWLPFEDFGITKPLPQTKEDYLEYATNVKYFISARKETLKKDIIGRSK